MICMIVVFAGIVRWPVGAMRPANGAAALVAAYSETVILEQKKIEGEEASLIILTWFTL